MADTIQVDITVTGSVELAALLVDGRNARGTATSGRAHVSPRDAHRLDWTVVGAMGTSYTIKLTPKSGRLVTGSPHPFKLEIVDAVNVGAGKRGFAVFP